MAMMIVIEKDNKTETIFEVAQTYVEGSSVIKTFRKQKKEKTMEDKKERQLITLSPKNIPRASMKQNANMWMN